MNPQKSFPLDTHTQEKCSKTFTIAGRDNNGSISNTLECIMYVYDLSQVGTNYQPCRSMFLENKQNFNFRG